MHETRLMHDLMEKLKALAAQHRARRITAVKVRLGALSHFSPEHFREHFEEDSRGTPAEGARLVIETCEDIHDPQAGDVVLLSVDIDHDR